ncbi:MAG: hypothetical protein M3N93_10405 [Acidobacteriota bacterium]|nr:hypothetical protein [Acidobacteriota bacterium]
MQGTPGFICGGAVDFGLAALYLPIRGGGYKFGSDCYAYGRDLETTDQFTIRIAFARGSILQRLRGENARYARDTALGLAWLELIVVE